MKIRVDLPGQGARSPSGTGIDAALGTEQPNVARSERKFNIPSKSGSCQICQANLLINHVVTETRTVYRSERSSCSGRDFRVVPETALASCDVHSIAQSGACLFDHLVVGDSMLWPC